MKLPDIQWPDLRAIALLGSFALNWDLIQIIKDDGTLLQNAAFMQYTGAITAGTIFVIINFLFGGTKSGAEAMTKMGDKITSDGGSKDSSATGQAQ